MKSGMNLWLIHGPYHVIWQDDPDVFTQKLRCSKTGRPCPKTADGLDTQHILFDRLAICIEVFDLAKPQFTKRSFYFGPVSDNNPDKVVRMYD